MEAPHPRLRIGLYPEDTRTAPGRVVVVAGGGRLGCRGRSRTADVTCRGEGGQEGGRRRLEARRGWGGAEASPEEV